VQCSAGSQQPLREDAQQQLSARRFDDPPSSHSHDSEHVAEHERKRNPEAAGSFFATTLSDILKTLLERNKQISPTLSLTAGDEFIFMVAHDMAMVPYQPFPMDTVSIGNVAQHHDLKRITAWGAAKTGPLFCRA
jgi:hypothetical protein